MAIQMSDFINKDGFSILVNFPTKIHGVTSDATSGYVLGRKFHSTTSVLSYLKDKIQASEEKIIQSLQLVKLKPSLYSVSLNALTLQESKKVSLALVLLLQSKVIVCEYFFEELIYSEQEYFKRFFRNLMYKHHISIILLENNMNFVCETVKAFYLFTKNGKYKYIDDFYQDEIYKYVAMPFSVELVKYLEKKGHKIDHDVTFNETLKSIYRGAV